MPFKLCVFRCECGAEYEDMLWKDHGDDSFDPDLECPECGTVNKQIIAAAGIAAYSAMSRDRQMACLKKRSEDHSRKHFKQNSDEIRAKIIAGDPARRR